MDGVPLPTTGELISLWGAWAVVLIVLIAAIVWFANQNKKKDETIAARDLTIQALRDAHAAAIQALNDKIIETYRVTTEKLAAAQQSSAATTQQSQQLATTLNSALDRLLPKG